jgi:hypothetical protein
MTREATIPARPADAHVLQNAREAQLDGATFRGRSAPHLAGMPECPSSWPECPHLAGVPSHRARITSHAKSFADPLAADAQLFVLPLEIGANAAPNAMTLHAK